MERAKREIPGFKEHIRKFEEQINIKSYAPSTVFSYSRCIAQICLYCRKSPLDLDLDEINSYLFAMKTDRDMSDTFFKHTSTAFVSSSGFTTAKTGPSGCLHEKQTKTSRRIFTARAAAPVQSTPAAQTTRTPFADLLCRASCWGSLQVEGFRH
jgi:hypothetical protein